MASAGGDPGDPVAKWEAATSSRAQHLGVPTSDILQSPTSIPYVVELVGVSGLQAVAPHRASLARDVFQEPGALVRICQGAPELRGKRLMIARDHHTWRQLQGGYLE